MGMSLVCVCCFCSHEYVDASCVPILWRYGFKRWASGDESLQVLQALLVCFFRPHSFETFSVS